MVRVVNTVLTAVGPSFSLKNNSTVQLQKRSVPPRPLGASEPSVLVPPEHQPCHRKRSEIVETQTLSTV